MNIINKVTLRHLKENKKRTLVTIIGTIVSVAMITAVATLAVSFIDIMQRQLIADEGEWHVSYYDVNEEQADAIGKDEETNKLLLSDDRGYAFLEEHTYDSKPYLFVKAYNDAALNGYPIDLNEGHLPQTDKEIVISEEIAQDTGVNYKIGDTITINLGERQYTFPTNEITSFGQNSPIQRDENGEVVEELKNIKEETYTIVGIMEQPKWEPSWAPGYTMITYLDTSHLEAADKINATVVLKDINNDLFDHAEALANDLQIEEYGFNNDLLRLHGVTDNDNVRKTIFSLATIIMVIIIIGSVSLIYNAFGISVSERSRHLGMLSSVGATKKQKRNSVFFEGAVIGIISIPLGIVAGLAGIGITFMFLNTIIESALGTTEKLQLVVTPWSILAACFISILTIFISTYLPARKASKISAIDAIRQSQDIKLTSKKVKTSKLVRKLFGLEAELGLKNLKRNKRRYRVTVFSIVISIFLFLTVSYFTLNSSRSLDITQNELNYDIEVYSGNPKNPLDNQFIEKVENMDDVTKSSIVNNAQFRNGYLSTWVDTDKISEYLKEEIDNQPELVKGGQYQYRIELVALDDESLKSYSEKVGVDVETLTNTEDFAAIVINKTSFYDPNKSKFIETEIYNGEAEDLLNINQYQWEKDEESYVNHVKIAALTDKYPMGLTNVDNGLIKMIVSESVLNELLAKVDNVDVQKTLYLQSDNPVNTQNKIEEMRKNNVHVYNLYQMKQQTEQLMLMMNVFTYGFISLITIISIANIFNTISTSISLRKREFAMLKSVGMTPKSFNKMINFESIFYGVKALLYGLPLSIAFMYFIYLASSTSIDYGFILPWKSLVVAIVAVFIIVGSAMLYSSAKIKKENIIETLKQENI